MRKSICAVFLLISVLSCSKQSPVIETKQVLVEEDKRNISALHASQLLDKSSDTGLESQLANINSFHRPDFRFVDFWKSLRFPAFDITKIDASNVTKFGPLGTKSCDIKASEAYLQFLIYLKYELKKDLTKQYLELIASHLEICKPQYDVSFSQIILKEISTYSITSILEEDLRASLNIIKFISHRNGQEINTILSSIFSRQIVAKISENIKNLDLAITFSALLKEIHPLNQALVSYPLEKFIGTPERVERILENLNFDEASALLKRLEDQLPFDKITIKPFMDTYLKKLDGHFLNAVTDQAYKGQYLDSLSRALELYALFDVTVEGNLNFIDYLLDKALLVFQTASDLDIVEEHSHESLLAASILARKLTQEEFSRVNLPANTNKISRAAMHIFKIKLAESEEVKVELKENFCENFELKPITSLNANLKAGCFKLDGVFQDLIISTSLKHSLFSVATISAKTLTLNGSGNFLGVIDLSNYTIHSKITETLTPDTHNAIVIPLLLGLHVEKSKGIFLKDAKYYFFYHWIYQAAEPGPAVKKDSLPMNGQNGGDLVLSDASSKFTLISRGGAGQSAPPPSSGGKGYMFKFAESEYEQWISEFLNFDSYLMVKGYRSEINLKQLNKIAKRNEDKKLIVFIDPNFTKHFSLSEQATLDAELDKVNALEGWGCETRECLLEKASEIAMNEFSSLVSLEYYQELLMKISPELTLENGPLGPEQANGNKGKDGKVILIHSLN